MSRKRRCWKLFGMVAALCVAMLYGCIVAQADSGGSPNRCMLGGSMYIRVSLGAKSDTIKNIKVFSGSSGKKTTSDMLARFRGVSGSYDEEGRPDGYEAQIEYYAEKTGTYRIQYDVCKKSGKKRGTYTQKVAVTPRGVGIRATFDGKEFYRASEYYFTTKASAELKFVADPGCEIKKIEMQYANSKGKQVTKNVTKKLMKGSRITFPQYGLWQEGDNDYSRDMWAYTFFAVTYTDTYSQVKETYTEYFAIASLASKWVKAMP